MRTEEYVLEVDIIPPHLPTFLPADIESHGGRDLVRTGEIGW